MRRNVDQFGADNSAQCGAMWINPAAAQGRGMANPDPEHTEGFVEDPCHHNRPEEIDVLVRMAHWKEIPRCSAELLFRNQH